MNPLRWRYRLGIQAPVSDAGRTIADTMESALVDPYFKSVAFGTLEAAGPTVFDFASDVARKHAHPDVRRFASALKDEASAEAALRVACWCYMSRVLGMNWPDRYGEVRQVARPRSAAFGTKLKSGSPTSARSTRT